MRAKDQGRDVCTLREALANPLAIGFYGAGENFTFVALRWLLFSMHFTGHHIGLSEEGLRPGQGVKLSVGGQDGEKITLDEISTNNIWRFVELNGYMHGGNSWPLMVDALIKLIRTQCNHRGAYMSLQRNLCASAGVLGRVLIYGMVG